MNMIGFYGNITETNNINAMIAKAVSEFGSVNIWVNNSGINYHMRKRQSLPKR